MRLKPPSPGDESVTQFAWDEHAGHDAHASLSGRGFGAMLAVCSVTEGEQYQPEPSICEEQREAMREGALGATPSTPGARLTIGQRSCWRRQGVCAPTYQSVREMGCPLGL